MKVLYSLLFGIVSGLLLFLSYSPQFTWVVFFCLVPFLVFNLYYSNSKINILLSSFSLLLTWNILNLQFLYSFSLSFYSSFLNKFAPLGILIYSVVGFLPFIFLLIKNKYRLLLFVCCWIMVEQLYLNWQLDSPFSSLGNILGAYPKLIQWYQYTGVLGGSIWILAINSILCITVQQIVVNRSFPKTILIASFVIVLLPTVSSLMDYYNYAQDNISRTVRIFSYDNKIDNLSLIKDLHLYYDTNDVPIADYTLLPELVISLNNQQPEQNREILEIRELIHKRGGSENFILGANLTAWKNQQVIAISINEDTLQKRYKEMLVPFGEKIPFPELMNPIIGLVYKYSISPYISPKKGSGLFKNKEDIFHVSLCYESFFENFLKQHLNHSAQVIFVVAREPFQFNNHYKNISLLMSQIQAITFQKYLVRSSWCGVSCVINTKGEVQQVVYNKNDVIDAKIFLNDKHSFFSNTKYNYLFLVAVLMFFVTLLSPIFSFIWRQLG